MSNHSSAVPHGDHCPSTGIFRKTSAFLLSFNSKAWGSFRDNLLSAFNGSGSASDGATSNNNNNNDKTAPPAAPLQRPAVKPNTLRLEFSKAADFDRISRFLDPVHKKAIDPKKYVVRREESVLRSTLTAGGGTFLRNDKDDIATMTMAYKMHDDGDSAKSSDYTEIGTTLSSMAGYNSAQLIVAAAALKEWWQNPPKNMLVAEIEPTNQASLKTYVFYLGWRPISDQTITADLFKRANATIDPADRDENAIWFHCDDSVITHQARTLLTFMDQGGLTHKLTRRHIPVDFSELDNVGLTRKRLSALANGETNRAKLKKLDL